MYRKIAGSVAIVLVVFLAITGVVMFSNVGSVFASSIEITGDSKDISIKPADRPLFTMDNMAPGDSESSTLTLTNARNSALTFTVSAVKESGDDILMEGLQIVVANADGEALYSGSLSGFNSVDLGAVASNRSKDFTFTMTFPQAAGDEYQGKTLSVKFVFTATGSSGNEHQSGGNSNDGKSKTDEVTEIIEPEEIVPDLPEEVEEPLVEEPLDIYPALPVLPEAPVDSGELPKTGEFPPVVIHGVGLVIILAGLLLRRKEPVR